MKNKVRSLKKLILEKIGLFKKANLIIYKKNPQFAGNSGSDTTQNEWLQLTEDDFE